MQDAGQVLAAGPAMQASLGLGDLGSQVSGFQLGGFEVKVLPCIGASSKSLLLSASSGKGKVRRF